VKVTLRRPPGRLRRRIPPNYNLRRLSSVALLDNQPEALKQFKDELRFVRTYLGEDYLQVIQSRLDATTSEIIIAIENQQ
jgi:hypothetical protein